MSRCTFKCRTCGAKTNADPTNPTEAERWRHKRCRACLLEMKIAQYRKWLLAQQDPVNINLAKDVFTEVFGP